MSARPVVRRPPVVVLARVTVLMRLASAVLRLVFRATARVRVEGTERPLPRAGPLIVIANHTSYVDPPLVGAWLQPRLGRPIQFMAKGQLFVPFLRPLLAHWGTIFVRPGGSDPDAYRAGLAVLRGGGVLGIFPEGTRSHDGALGDALPGAALIASRSGAPILPLGISGAQRYLARGRRLPRFGARITLRVGEPFTLTLDPTLQRRAAVEAASIELMGRLTALLDESQRGRWGAGAR